MKNTVSYQLTYLYKRFLAHTTRELKNFGLSYGQLPFILYVGKHPGCTPAMLKNQLQMDWGHSQRSIEKLVQSGLMLKMFQEEDRRNSHLTLTQKGEEAFDVSHRVFEDWDQNHLTALTSEERAHLCALLQKLSEAEAMK